MSWDVLVYRFPRDIKIAELLPKDFKPPIIGSREEVAKSIRATFPNTNTSNLSWLIIDGEGFSIEVNVGRHEPCDGFMLHVRGGAMALGAVIKLTQIFAARALDLTSGEFLDQMADSDGGFRQWREYRDKVIKNS